MSGFVCLYTGPPDQCQECGGFDPTVDVTGGIAPKP